MNYHVEFSKQAVKNLQKMDKHTYSLILGWIKKNLENCTDPRRMGKPLVANHRGHWRYRIGDYRLICEIKDEKVLILILSAGHRLEIYS